MNIGLIIPQYISWQRYNALLDFELGGIPQVLEENWKLAAIEFYNKTNNIPNPSQFENWREWSAQLSLGEK